MNHCKIVGVIEILRSGEKLGIENDIKRQLVLVNVLILASGSSGKKCCGTVSFVSTSVRCGGFCYVQIVCCEEWLRMDLMIELVNGGFVEMSCWGGEIFFAIFHCGQSHSVLCLWPTMCLEHYLIYFLSHSNPI